jgi:hypothetical protein
VEIVLEVPFHLDWILIVVGHIPQIAEKIAQLHGVSVDLVYEHARKNTTSMYGI